MRENILQTLVAAGKYNSNMGSFANQRVIGEKADVVTQGDIEIGDLITQKLLEYDGKIIVESEEHGKQTNFDREEIEDFYIAIDDIDGTNNLRVGDGVLPYASMVVAFDGSKKTEDGYKYSDYSHAACIDYVSSRIYYTEKDLRAVEVYDFNLEKIKDSKNNKQDNSNLALTLSTDVVSTQRGGALGYAKASNAEISILPGILDGVYKNYAIVDSGCSVVEYAMVGMGIRNGYVSSGKKQHELPLLYAFANETGLDMIDFSGQSYENKKYDFNGKDAEVIAASQKAAADVLELVRKQKVAINQVVEIFREYREKQKTEEKMDSPRAPKEDKEVSI